MQLPRLAGWLAIVVGSGVLLSCGEAKSQSSAQKTHLRVVLYPFIPEFNYAAETVKRMFEKENPNVELTIVDLTTNYYVPPEQGKTDPSYVGDVQTDVYELDSVFLADFVNSNKIQPLPDDLLLPAGQLLKNAYAGSMLNGKRYGSAHWACGNFLFFMKANAPAKGPTTIKELAVLMGAGSNEKLLVDMRGRLTLGEFYLGSAVAKYKDFSGHLSSPDPSLLQDLVSIFKLCPTGSCRDQIYHEDTGTYGQAFALGRSKALIGYSELLHSVLKEGAFNGGPPTDQDLAVEALPLDEEGMAPVSWVDSFAIRTGCTGDCFKASSQFIRFMQRDDVYMKLLLPTEPSYLHDPTNAKPVPAYLLPAKASLYANNELTSVAHLYPKLKTLIETTSVPIAANLNADLRTVAKSVDKALTDATPK